MLQGSETLLSTEPVTSVIRFLEAGAYTRAPEQVKRAGLLGRSIFWRTCLGVLRARAVTDASWAAWTQGGARPLPAPSGLQGLALWRGSTAPGMLRACHLQTPGVRPRPSSTSVGHGRAPPPPPNSTRGLLGRASAGTVTATARGPAGRWTWPRETRRSPRVAETPPGDRWSHGHRRHSRRSPRAGSGR